MSPHRNNPKEFVMAAPLRPRAATDYCKQNSPDLGALWGERRERSGPRSLGDRERPRFYSPSWSQRHQYLAMVLCTKSSAEWCQPLPKLGNRNTQYTPTLSRLRRSLPFGFPRLTFFGHLIAPSFIPAAPRVQPNK